MIQNFNYIINNLLNYEVKYKLSLSIYYRWNLYSNFTCFRFLMWKCIKHLLIGSSLLECALYYTSVAVSGGRMYGFPQEALDSVAWKLLKSQILRIKGPPRHRVSSGLGTVRTPHVISAPYPIEPILVHKKHMLSPPPPSPEPSHLLGGGGVIHPDPSGQIAFIQ